MGRIQDIPRDRGWPVQAGKWRLAIFRTSEGLRAVENQCRHVGNPIDDGPVQGQTVTCPWHGWQYDLRTGDHLTVFGRRPGLRTFGVRVEGDEVQVDVGDR